MRVRGPLFFATIVLIFLSLSASPALSGTITIPNGSFESPYVDMVSPYATSNIADWQKAPAPAWWTGAGYSAQQWTESAGTFVNVPFVPIDNVDGRQAAFMFSPLGYELFQDLNATFKLNKSYHLTVGIEGGGYGMQLGTPMEIRLYYRDAENNRVAIGATVAMNTNATGTMSHLTDYHLDIPTILSTNPWATKNIGVQLISTATFENAGGFWNIDNVRLMEVPEPGSMVLLAIGLGMLVARRWFASKK